MATVSVTGGKIKGFVTKTNPETVEVNAFKSVPIGKFKRFQKPEPYGSWDGVKDCSALTPRKVIDSIHMENIGLERIFILNIYL